MEWARRLGAVLLLLLVTACSDEEQTSVADQGEPLSLFVRLQSESPLFARDPEDFQRLLDSLDEQMASGRMPLQTSRPLRQFLKRLQVHFRDQTTAQTGLRDQALAFWFMRNNLPVFQMELADGQRFSRALEQAQTEAGERWDQAEYQGVRFYRSKGAETELIWLVRQSRLLFSWFPVGQESQALKRLLDGRGILSAASWQQAWNQLPAEFHPSGYATVAGWLDYPRIMQDLLQEGDSLAQNWRRILEIPEEAQTPACRQALSQWLELFPGAQFSQRDDRKGNRQVKVLFLLKPSLAARVSRIVSVFTQPMQERGLIQMQVAIHVQRLLEELQGFLQQDAPREKGCRWLAPAQRELDRLDRQLEHRPPPALVRQISGLGISVDTVSEALDADSIRSMVWVQMDQPETLLNLAGMLDPKLRAQQWPADGKARPLKSAMAYRTQIRQPLWLAVNDHALGLALGEDSAPALERVLSSKAKPDQTLFWIRQDLKRLFVLMRKQARVMAAIRLRPEAIEHMDRYARYMDEMELRLQGHENGLMIQLELTAP